MLHDALDGEHEISLGAVHCTDALATRRHELGHVKKEAKEQVKAAETEVEKNIVQLILNACLVSFYVFPILQTVEEWVGRNNTNTYLEGKILPDACVDEGVELSIHLDCLGPLQP